MPSVDIPLSMYSWLIGYIHVYIRCNTMLKNIGPNIYYIIKLILKNYQIKFEFLRLVSGY